VFIYVQALLLIKTPLLVLLLLQLLLLLDNCNVFVLQYLTEKSTFAFNVVFQNSMYTNSKLFMHYDFI